MGVEIERKFLVKGEPWLGHQNTVMQQGYLASNECTVRVRISDTKAWLTVKGPVQGISRPEYEYEIPLSEAEEMLDNFCGLRRISKTRYLVPHKGFTWEVDVFEGHNKGLVIAEIELDYENVDVPLPDWVDIEVSHDPRFRNSSLLENPWPFES